MTDKNSVLNAVDGIIRNANLLTFDSRDDASHDLCKNDCVAWRDGTIVFVGDSAQLPQCTSNHVFDAEGALLSPGFIDCHTHLVFAGDRSDEFESRLQGKSYSSIARQGGGIMRTVESTRSADFSYLYDQALSRIERLIESGVTTLEIKSGYGLNLEDEIKSLYVVKKLQERLPITIKATCLAAHTLPADFDGTEDDYIDWVCTTVLPEIKTQQLADAVDIFCEKIAFSPNHMRRLFETARRLGFSVKGHVEQLSQSYGTDVVCAYSGLSADHLEYINEKQAQNLREKNVTAVLLPGAYYYLGGGQKPPVDLLRKHGVDMAVATDLNPGSSPLHSITSAANMASVLFGLTMEESLRGITINAAKALGMANTKGQLKVGMDADMILWPFHNPHHVIYELPAQKPKKLWVQGEIVTDVGGHRGAT